MIRPIPKRLLPHKCTYKEYQGNNGEKDVWADGTELSYVKIEEKLQFKVTSNGRELVGNARMFYDTVNSIGLTNKPVSNSIILFNSKEYKIVDTDILYAEIDKAHHYEVLLK